MSNPDDYISNILVTLFQMMTILVLITPALIPSYRHTVLQFYYIITALLLLYGPAGKLRHTVYFFAARYHLGHFYGWRGVWPPRSIRKAS